MLQLREEETVAPKHGLGAPLRLGKPRCDSSLACESLIAQTSELQSGLLLVDGVFLDDFFRPLYGECSSRLWFQDAERFPGDEQSTFAPRDGKCLP